MNELDLNDAVRAVVHTNECSDEGGWFAYWRIDGSQSEIVDDERYFEQRVNGQPDEATAVIHFLDRERMRLDAQADRIVDLEATLRALSNRPVERWQSECAGCGVAFMPGAPVHEADCPIITALNKASGRE